MSAEKDRGEVLLGRLFLKRPRLLDHWITGGTGLSGSRRAVFNSLVRALDDAYYSNAADTGRREEIKQLCMGRDSGVAWAKRYLLKGFPEPQTASLPMFGRLEEWFGSGEIHTAHQVACCSGRETAYFAGQYPKIHFTGSDCDPAVVAFLNDHWGGMPNLGFVELHMDKPLQGENSLPATDLLFASGGFHYMDPESLLGFLRDARRHAARIALSQPMDRSFHPEDATSTPRGMLSWNHPYARLLAEAGWKRIEWREGFVAELPKWKNIAAWACA